MIEVQSRSALATVQDLGRSGALRWGVGTSGAMDPMALAAGNLLLGNATTAAAVEIQVFPFQFAFLQDCTFALTGADTAARLDDQVVLPWWRTCARAGQVLRLGTPRQGAWCGSRAYLCVAGGIDVPQVLGSRSTQLRGAFGGLEGRTLREGDRLAFGGPESQDQSPMACRLEGLTEPGFGLCPAALAMPLTHEGLPAVRVLPAAEYERFTEASREAFWAQPWRITHQSDRYGYRLQGPGIEATTPMELRSHGIVPGVIQVPPGGQPIVQMRDAQPSGGYPKIGTVIEADLWRLGQAPIGSSVRFVRTTWQEAVNALEVHQRWLTDVRRKVSLWNSSSTRHARVLRAPAHDLRGRQKTPHAKSDLLASWLAATDIDRLDFSGPDGECHLVNRAGKVSHALTRHEPSADLTGPARTELVRAPSLGTFLHCHPLQAAPLARPGRHLVAGEVWGLLQVGALLTPVVAPQDCTLGTLLVAHGAVVGFGEPLAEVRPTSPVRATATLSDTTTG
jgi:biotin-dependent carboxylase-like uncharacterized protein